MHGIFVECKLPPIPLRDSISTSVPLASMCPVDHSAFRNAHACLPDAALLKPHSSRDPVVPLRIRALVAGEMLPELSPELLGLDPTLSRLPGYHRACPYSRGRGLRLQHGCYWCRLGGACTESPSVSWRCSGSGGTIGRGLGDDARGSSARCRRNTCHRRSRAWDPWSTATRPAARRTGSARRSPPRHGALLTPHCQAERWSR